MKNYTAALQQDNKEMYKKQLSCWSQIEILDRLHIWFGIRMDGSKIDVKGSRFDKLQKKTAQSILYDWPGFRPRFNVVFSALVWGQKEKLTRISNSTKRKTKKNLQK